MNYWWVNHKQTFRVELEGGYIWSPKANSNGKANPSYDNLTKTAVGDIIFSYANGEIGAIGIIIGEVVESPQPLAFGSIGDQWARVGWLIPIKWSLIPKPIAPKKYISQISPLLPSKYSPIQQNGNGNQGIYLASISGTLGRLLVDMIDIADIGAHSVVVDLQNRLLEEQQVEKIRNSDVSATVRAQLIEARVGQGQFRIGVERIESKCRVTGLEVKSLLIASHIKPWRWSSNTERLDGHNGLLLSPHVDRLFDKGFISFSDSGKILLANSDVMNPILRKWSINPTIDVGNFTDRQKHFLEFHRDQIHSEKIKDLTR